MLQYGTRCRCRDVKVDVPEEARKTAVSVRELLQASALNCANVPVWFAAPSHDVCCHKIGRFQPGDGDGNFTSMDIPDVPCNHLI